MLTWRSSQWLLQRAVRVENTSHPFRPASHLRLVAAWRDSWRRVHLRECLRRGLRGHRWPNTSRVLVSSRRRSADRQPATVPKSHSGRTVRLEKHETTWIQHNGSGFSKTALALRIVRYVKLKASG